MINIFIFIFIGTIGWGTSFYFVKILLATMTPIEIVLYRMCISSISLLVIIVILKIEFSKFKTLMKHGLIVGIFNMTLPFYLTTIAQKNISSSLSSVINGLTPLLTFLVGITLFKNKEKINGYIFLSIMIGMIGLILVNIDLLFSHQSIANLFILILSSLSYGIAANYIRYCVKDINPLMVAMIAVCIATILMLVIKLTLESSTQWHYPVTIWQGLVLFWLGIMSSGICLYLYFFLIHRIGPVITSMITYLMTITAVLIGTLILHEHMTGMAIIGCICIVLSLLIINHTNTLQKIAYGNKVWDVRS